MSGIVAQPVGITSPPIDLQLQQNMIQFVGPVVDVQPDEKPLAVSLREINEGLLSLEANPEA